jgi:thiamine kinase-like enzyme
MDQTVDFPSLVREALGGMALILDQPKRITVRPSAELWEVATSHGIVTIRVICPHPADVHFKSGSELAVMSVTATHAISPKALFMDAKRGVLVTERAPGRVWSSRDARSPRNIVRIAALLRQLHSLQIPPQAVHVDISGVLLSYWNTLLEQGRAPKAGNTKIRARIKKLAETFATTGPRVICHTAIHNTNIVDNADGNERTAKGLMLTDWEYAGICDPIFDLASLCCHHEYGLELRTALLRAYYESDSAAIHKRLDNACVLQSYIRELWFTAREF